MLPTWLAGMGFIVATVVVGNIALTIADVIQRCRKSLPAYSFCFGVWVLLAVATKWLHDRDKSAWWLLLFYVVPSVLDAIGRLLGWAGLILDLIGAAIAIWALIELGFLRGTKGPNDSRSGPVTLAGRGLIVEPSDGLVISFDGPGRMSGRGHSRRSAPLFKIFSYEMPRGLRANDQVGIIANTGKPGCGDIVDRI